MITVTAQGGVQAPGIGSGWRGTCGDITIGASASGTAEGGEDSPWDIGPGGEGGINLSCVGVGMLQLFFYAKKVKTTYITTQIVISYCKLIFCKNSYLH